MELGKEIQENFVFIQFRKKKHVVGIGLKNGSEEGKIYGSYLQKLF